MGGGVEGLIDVVGESSGGVVEVVDVVGEVEEYERLISGKFLLVVMFGVQ